MFRSSPPEVFSQKDTVQVRSEPTGEQTCRSAIPINLLCNFIEIKTHARMRPLESTSHPQNTSPLKNTSRRLLLNVKRALKDLNNKKVAI